MRRVGQENWLAGLVIGKKGCPRGLVKRVSQKV